MLLQRGHRPVYRSIAAGEIFMTAKETMHRLSPVMPRGGGHSQLETVRIEPRVSYQEILGFGGAFTEAAATTLLRLPAKLQQEVMLAYFDLSGGHGYTLCRTHINSCDFALGNYAYCETNNDFALENFNIDRDRAALIPMIRRAMVMAKGGLRLFASPWSPPAWMKTNEQMNNGGKLREDCRDVWARYYCRFVKEYAREGIGMWGLSVQNEPAAVQRWDSCIYTAEEERDFVRDHLGPALHAAGLEEIKLVMWDHNRDQMFERARVMYDDAAAAKYVWGTGFHWYCDDKFDNLQAVHDAYPDKHLLFTEGCQEKGPHMGSWDVGERYANSIINDLNRWTVGWVDWNLLLDQTGGPNHVGNYCSAPILADTNSGTIHYQSSYYYIGHFSRFIRPGARRVLCSTTADALQATAAVNPDGSVVVVVLNRSDKQRNFVVALDSHQTHVDCPPHSILTVRLAGMG